MGALALISDRATLLPSPHLRYSGYLRYGGNPPVWRQYSSIMVILRYSGYLRYVGNPVLTALREPNLPWVPACRD